MLRLYVKDVAVQRLYAIVPTHPKFNIQNPKFNINLPHMIKAENICKSYNQLQVLKGINLNIGDDQIDSKAYQDYVGDTIINGIIYKETIKLYSTKDNENYSYINKENGMIHFVDKANNTIWTLIKP
jgi:hypothetical protein